MTTQIIPAGWSDDGHTLTAPNKVAVVKGFRNEVVSWTGGWEADNWPCAAEAQRAPVEDANPALGAGSWQPFRWRVLGWTAAKGVYVMWVGQELLHARTQLQILQVTKPAPPAEINTTEVLAAAHMIEETAQHIMDEVQRPQPIPTPVENPA